MKKSKRAGRDSVSPFRNKLWELFRDLAKGMDGADVVVALKQAGEEIWAVGIDDSYSNMSQEVQDSEAAGNAFDTMSINGKVGGSSVVLADRRRLSIAGDE